MFKSYLSPRIVIGLTLILALLSWLAFSSYINTRKMISSSRWVAHTHDALYQAQKVLAIAVNIEIGQRGYALTGNPEFLKPYQKGLNEIDYAVDSLLLLVNDNEGQVRRLKNLEHYVHLLTEFSKKAVQARQTSLSAAIDVNGSLEGKIAMDSIRNAIAIFEQHEKGLLKERIRASNTHIYNFNIGFIGLLLVTGTVLIGVFVAINDNLRSRAVSAARLKTVYAEIEDLYDNAPCGYHSLNADGYFENINNTMLRWLGYKKEEVVGKMKFTAVIVPEDIQVFEKNFPIFKREGSIKDVEFTLVTKNGSPFPVILNAVAIYDGRGNYIKSRSTTFDNRDRKLAEDKFKNLNKELEAFSYSVSHDLRAPLRSIDGYSRILIEDHSEKLGGEGQRIINVIINNAKRMGQLIDDLLEFSRLGRMEVSYSEIDMTTMVNGIVRDLREHEPTRDIEFITHPLLTSIVDAQMIKQVWVNLVSNAIKYTGKKPKSMIEIDSVDRNNEVVYSIKDNGVGFDMQYVDKLFGVFQRLHKIQEFSGTGVGLAIVKRIVTRHGGKVWAEGKVNEGATFYFSIPKKHA
jgi:PAS domain S-box-containing protein